MYGQFVSEAPCELTPTQKFLYRIISDPEANVGVASYVIQFDDAGSNNYGVVLPFYLILGVTFIYRRLPLIINIIIPRNPKYLIKVDTGNNFILEEYLNSTTTTKNGNKSLHNLSGKK